MTSLRNKWTIATIAVLCWAIAASLVSGYYYYQYSNLITRLEKSGEGGLTAVGINLGIDYGNGTRIWYNGTKGVTLYDAMVKAGWSIESESYGVMGLYIKSINGVKESSSNMRYWGWWSWTDFGWYHGQAACDKYVVSPGEVILWYYSPTDPQTYEMSAPP
ncbi:MAG: DUF4430 domain-containing protein [Nitrososphaerota archaeon]|nr:DUF4430 domain-containing protein [Candidatus Bathyarchaeota archaeon]MDW8194129.1 DUF4430 domain-containing protein [Nitrososphaerota archaeon]